MMLYCMLLYECARVSVLYGCVVVCMCNESVIIKKRVELLFLIALQLCVTMRRCLQFYPQDKHHYTSTWYSMRNYQEYPRVPFMLFVVFCNEIFDQRIQLKKGMKRKPRWWQTRGSRLLSYPVGGRVRRGNHPFVVLVLYVEVHPDWS